MVTVLRRRTTWALLALLVVVLVGCRPAAEGGAAGGCAAEAAPFVETANALLAEWDTIEAEALTVSEADLEPYIERLQDVRARLQALEAPECATEARGALRRYMDEGIDLQNALWANECRLCIEDMRTEALAARTRALAALEALAEG